MYNMNGVYVREMRFELSQYCKIRLSLVAVYAEPIQAGVARVSVV